MSLNLGSAELTHAYNAVRNNSSKWVVFTLTASNDLRVEEEGGATGSLSDMTEEFSDGKIQFAFAQVVDTTSKLVKYVLINWCGDGVPVARKSRFHSYANDVARVLTGAHVVIQARQESDVDPAVIKKRVAESGGSKYTTAGSQEPAQPAKMERPAPVGSTYKPIGRPDIASMTSGSKPEPPSSVGTSWTPKHNELQELRQSTAGKSQQEDKPEVVSGAYQPKHNELQEIRAKAAKEKPEAPAAVGTSWQPKHNELQEIRSRAAAEREKERNAPAASSPAVEKPKPSYERPEPVGTSYAPVSVPKAGKLGDRLAAFQQQPASSSSLAPGGGSGGAGKKLTWSERQAITKKQQEEEEAASSAAIAKAAAPPAAPPAPAAPSAPVAPAAPPAPAAPEAPAAPSMPPRAPSFPAPPKTAGQAKDDDDWDAEEGQDSDDDMPRARAPPTVNMGARPGASTAASSSNVPQAPPPPPMAPAAPAAPVQEDEDVKEQAENMSKLNVSSGKGQRAKVLFEYQAEEENELDLAEGQTVNNVDQLDEGWWSGEINGKTGLFPANYVELIEGDDEVASSAPPAPPAPPAAPSPPRAPSPPPAPAAPAAPPAPFMPSRPAAPEETSGPRAKALYDYTADEDNEITFAEGVVITAIEHDSDDWWSGEVNGNRGLFPANYVEMIEE